MEPPRTSPVSHALLSAPGVHITITHWLLTEQRALSLVAVHTRCLVASIPYIGSRGCTARSHTRKDEGLSSRPGFSIAASRFSGHACAGQKATNQGGGEDGGRTGHMAHPPAASLLVLSWLGLASRPPATSRPPSSWLRCCCCPPAGTCSSPRRSRECC